MLTLTTCADEAQWGCTLVYLFLDECASALKRNHTQPIYAKLALKCVNIVVVIAIMFVFIGTDIGSEVNGMPLIK